MIKAVLFDLDGTVLGLDQDEFTNTYFGYLAAKFAGIGYEPKQLIKDVWAGTKAMVMNDGSKTNEEAFWESFFATYGEKAVKDRPLFDEFYRTDFQKVQAVTHIAPYAKEVVDYLKAHEIRCVLATNPVFPSFATESRIRWSGFEPSDFEWFTAYENAHFSKPNPKYYLEVLEHCHLKPEECLMVGNDVEEDLVAASSVGIPVYLITEHCINRKEADLSSYEKGSFEDLLKKLSKMLDA